MTQAEKDAAFLVDWLKTQVDLSSKRMLAPPGHETNRRFYQAFQAMSEADWRLLVTAALMRRMPVFPSLPPVERLEQAPVP